MRVERSVLLPCPAPRCVQALQTPQTMCYVAHPMLRFVPLSPPTWPPRWEAQRYRVAVRFFGLLPMGTQQITISWLDRSAEFGHFHVEMQDHGCGTFMSRWDHTITVQACQEACRYTDRVDIAAGLLTPLVWLFAWCLFWHRQRRWKRLVAHGMDLAARKWVGGSAGGGRARQHGPTRAASRDVSKD